MPEGTGFPCVHRAGEEGGSSKSCSLLCQRPAPPSSCSGLSMALENHSPRLMELPPRAKPNMTFRVSGSLGVKPPPPPAPDHGQVQIFLLWPSSTRLSVFFQSFTLLPDSGFFFLQYFALNLLLYLISLAAAVFSTLTTNHKSTSWCVRDCLCLGMLVSGGAAQLGVRLHLSTGWEGKGRKSSISRPGSLTEITQGALLMCVNSMQEFLCGHRGICVVPQTSVPR